MANIIPRSDVKKSSRKKSSSKKRLIIAVAALVLLAAGYAAWHFWIGPAREAAKTANEAADSYTASSFAAPSVTDYDAKQKALDEKIAATTDASEKANLYIEKADLSIIKNGYSQESVTFTQQAESTAASYRTALSLAMSYEALDQNQEAARYYRLYLSRMTPEQKQQNQAEYTHYEQIAIRLEKS